MNHTSHNPAPACSNHRTETYIAKTIHRKFCAQLPKDIYSLALNKASHERKKDTLRPPALIISIIIYRRVIHRTILCSSSPNHRKGEYIARAIHCGILRPAAPKDIYSPALSKSSHRGNKYSAPPLQSSHRPYLAESDIARNPVPSCSK